MYDRVYGERGSVCVCVCVCIKNFDYSSENLQDLER